MSGAHVLVVGSTSWGCTLAMQLARAGSRVSLHCRSAAAAEQLSAEREERRLLPGIALPDSLEFTTTEAVPPSPDAIFFVVPSQRLRDNVEEVLPALARPLPPLVSASKGLEIGTELRMSEVMAEKARTLGEAPPLVALSGPNIAREVALGLPATTVVACRDVAVAETLRDMLMTPALRVYTSSDIVGVELGGALKNVIAIGVGIGDGLNLGENARAALTARGLAEITRLGMALGAEPLTLTGLAGLGDLILTCTSQRSRNRYVGEQIGKGRSLDTVLGEMVHVAEGVDTTRVARTLARRVGVEMPIVDAIYRVLSEGQQPMDAVRSLMTRAAQQELVGRSSP